jgi:transaldolase
VRYVEELIGSDTVTTLPKATLLAFEEHGRVAPTLTEGVEGASRIFRELRRAGIDLGRLTGWLERDGVTRFARSVDSAVQLVARQPERAEAA